MIRVVLADDHQVVRQGLRVLLEAAEDIVVVGEAHDGAAAVDLVKKLTPDVIVLDIGMPDMNGIQASAHIRAHSAATQVVILSMYEDETLARQALRQGARAYVLKRAPAAELLMAIRAVSRGEAYLSPAIAACMLNDFLAQRDTSEEASLYERLTAREHQTLQRIAEGRTNSEIAADLQISIKTVEKHRASLMAKLGVHDLANLIRTALRHRLIVDDD